MLTRFAPSPTGLLHLGHLCSALYVWGIAKKCDAKICLRIEDHDRQRCRAEFEQAIYQDLSWLGFHWDHGPESGVVSSYRQSDCSGYYEEALAQLTAAGQVYACSCSRRDIEQAAGTSHRHEELAYPGTCSDGRHGDWSKVGLGLRWKMPAEVVSFHDMALGEQTQIPRDQCGDLLIRDREGNWTYQFAVVVDDLRHRISLITRGIDILSSTGRQEHLAAALGRDWAVRYFHHATLAGPDGEKLSKRHGAKSIRAWRDSGKSVEDLLGMVLYEMRLISDQRPTQLSDAISIIAAQHIGVT
jgi:glutamyl-Q tRNA(Asp) synthetase